MSAKKTIIDDKLIRKLLQTNKSPSESEVEEILYKALEFKGLSLQDVSLLLAVDNQDLLERIFETARLVTDRVYGRKVSVFVPIYVSNDCANNCVYCAFRKDNRIIHREKLDLEELVEEVKAAQRVGHKRICLVFAEDPEITAQFVVQCIQCCFEQGVREVCANVAGMSVSDFSILAVSGLESYRLFQETYHKESYINYHPTGPKHDYWYRLTTFDRAIQGGMVDWGTAILFGLYDYKYEMLAQLMHFDYMRQKYGVGPHSVSFPRVCPAIGSPLDGKVPYPVTDLELKKSVAVTRLAIPYTGLIITERERPEMRRYLLKIGVTEVSCGSESSPGGYKRLEVNSSEKAWEYVYETEQFKIPDRRTASESILDLCLEGFIPSFCASCKRKGRTGKLFQDQVRSCQMKKYCIANAILSFKEYLLDYGSTKMREVGEPLLASAISELNDQKIFEDLEHKIKRIEGGERDLYF